MAAAAVDNMLDQKRNFSPVSEVSDEDSILGILGDQILLFRAL